MVRVVAECCPGVAVVVAESAALDCVSAVVVESAALECVAALIFLAAWWSVAELALAQQGHDNHKPNTYSSSHAHTRIRCKNSIGPIGTDMAIAECCSGNCNRTPGRSYQAGNGHLRRILSRPLRIRLRISDK
jgi:hypothetical protein